MQRRVLCRSRRELSNAYLLAKFGFDTAENDASKVVLEEAAIWAAEPGPPVARGANAAGSAR